MAGLFESIIDNLGKTKIRAQGSGSQSGKTGFISTGDTSAIQLPKGITSDSQKIDITANVTAPVTDKFSILGDVQYNKFRDKIEKGDQELFLQDAPSNIDRKVGIGYNEGGEGFSGYAKYGIDNEKPEYFVQYKKSFADGGSTQTNKTNLTEETFVKLRIQKKNLNHKEFADYLNNQTEYYPDPKQADKFTNVSVGRRYDVAKSKGKFPLNFIIKGSIQDRTLTPEKYKSVIGEKDYLKLKDNPTKLKNRYEFELKKANDPNFLKIRAERNLAKTKAMSPLEYEEKILEPARKRNQKVRGDSPKFTVNRRDAKSMAWKDLVSRSYETANRDPYFTFETPVKPKKKYNTEDMKKIVLKDSKGNKFTYDTLFEDVKKIAGETEFKNFKNTYEQRVFLNKEGITTELNKLYKITPGQRKSVFNIQHIEGFNKNPFKVHMTFGNQNLNEAYSRKSFTSDFGKADTYSKKKTAINKYYKSLGPDIVAQIGKQPRGTAKPLIELLNKAKINLQPDIKARAVSLGSFPSQLAEAPQMSKSAIKTAAKSVGKVLGVAALPLEAYFMKQMYDEGKTMTEILSSPLMLESVVGDAQDLLKMNSLERQAVTNERIATDESLLDTDFSQPYKKGLQAVDTEMVKDRVAQERAAEEAKRKADRNQPKPSFTLPINYGISSFDDQV